MTINARLKRRHSPDLLKSQLANGPPRPVLRFSPAAWAKLLFLRDVGHTEIGAFGVTAADDRLYVEELHLIAQQCSLVSVAFDDAAVADFFDRQVDRGLHPEQFARIWIHTHPADCPLPSSVDEETFARAFGRSDWAMMFILARGGARYARLAFHAGPGAALEIDVEVDYRLPFVGSAHEEWYAEYQAAVYPQALVDPTLFDLFAAWDSNDPLAAVNDSSTPLQRGPMIDK